MELKKVGVVYTSWDVLTNKKTNLQNYFDIKYIDNKKHSIFKVETNKGINFVVSILSQKLVCKTDIFYYWDILGYNAGALAKFQQHTNLMPLSIREYNDIKGGAPYQVFKSNDKFINDHFTFISYE